MFKEFYIYNYEVTLPQSSTGTSFTEGALTMFNDYDFVVKRVIHQATDDRIYLKLYDTATNRYLFNAPEDLRTVSGKALSSITSYGFKPYNVVKPIFIRRGTQFKISAAEFANTVGGNTLRLSFHGERLGGYAPFDIVSRQPEVPIVFESSTITAGANATVPASLSINDDADFVCTKITGIATGAGLLTITDNLRNRDTWSNIPTHIGNFIGNSQFPNILSAPRYITRNSTLSISWQDLTGSSNSLVLQIHGYKRNIRS